MEPEKNPYVPTAGAPPAVLVGREPLIEGFRTTLARVMSGRAEQSVIPYGLRGVGKTVLLNSFVVDAKRAAYIVAYLEADEQRSFLHKLAIELQTILFSLDTPARVNEYAKRAMRIFKSFTLRLGFDGLSLSIGVEPERGLGDSGDLQLDLTALFVAIGEAARAQETAVLVAVDEAQYLSEAELAAIIMAMHRINQLSLPVLFVATGLPQILQRLGEAKSYAERLFNFCPIGALSESEAREAIVAPAKMEGVRYTDEAISRIIEVSGGYPFFVQLFAYDVWNAASASPIGVDVVNAIEPLTLSKLDNGFFSVRYRRCSPRERFYLRAMAELGEGPYSSQDVAEVADSTQRQLGPARDSLIKKGMIYSPEHGRIDFTVPLFDAFMRRTEPAFAPMRQTGTEEA
ncbi:MAG TPA: ATP-binding protein [Candidatus Cybelea sp.]